LPAFMKRVDTVKKMVMETMVSIRFFIGCLFSFWVVVGTTSIVSEALRFNKCRVLILKQANCTTKIRQNANSASDFHYMRATVG
jgi:hypothetical protein